MGAGQPGPDLWPTESLAPASSILFTADSILAAHITYLSEDRDRLSLTRRVSLSPHQFFTRASKMFKTKFDSSQPEARRDPETIVDVLCYEQCFCNS